MNDLKQEGSAFYRMLTWLDPDPDLAGQIYNDVQRKLIRTFACRGCVYPEYEVLAQDTIERVTRKFEDPGNEFSENYVGTPIAYFYGVARYVYREYMRNKKDEHQQIQHRVEAPQTESEDDCLHEYRQQCLEECLKRENEEDRILVLQYYQEDRRKKIDQRLKMADKQRENLNRLRIRMCRIRKRLRECVNECVDRKSKASS